jgi:hypothetical protein
MTLVRQIARYFTSIEPAPPCGERVIFNGQQVRCVLPAGHIPAGNHRARPHEWTTR